MRQREGRRVRQRTLANLSEGSPRKVVETLHRLLRNEPLGAPAEAFAIQRSRPHGHAAAVLGMLEMLEMLEMLGLETVEAGDPHAAMDWLGTRQAKIEKALAKRHLHDGKFIRSAT